MRTDRLELVKKVLESSAEIAAWYKTEHGVTIDMLTNENVNTYNGGNYGDIAGLIIEDGITHGIITE